MIIPQSPPPPPRQKNYFITRPLDGVEFVAGIQQLHRIELMWRLFNAWPNTSPRLEKTKAATSRMDQRRTSDPVLPPRWAYKTTAEYYDAVLPLMMARRRFILYLNPNAFLHGVHKALQTLLPLHLR